MSGRAVDGRLHCWIAGVVQGVGFRAAARRAAEAAGCRGFVRNLADGRVELVAEGAPPALASLLAWCRRGPPGAVVTAVETHDEPPQGVPAGFRITA